jgi:hypothetical protein
MHPGSSHSSNVARNGPRRRAGTAALVAALAALAVAATPTLAARPNFVTSQPSMLTALEPGSSATPLMSVGDKFGGYVMEALPDGIAVSGNKNGRVVVYLNHETSTVPFPFNGVAPTEANSQSDYKNAVLSRLLLSSNGLDVISASKVIPSTANYQRFCSNFLARRIHGFDRQLLLTSEEATDFVSRTGRAWPVPQSEPPSEQAGVVVAYDPVLDQYRSIYGMGRLNHENATAIPGYGYPVILTGDDTFTTNPAQSQLYLYTASSRQNLWNDNGFLAGFVSDDPAYNDYYDFAPGSTASISGHFVSIDPAAAKGTQSALEADSDAKGVFQFLRIEDIAYDRNYSNVIYFADSGRAVTSDASNPFPSTNGRIFKMVLDATDPTHVLSLSVLIEGEGMPVKTVGAIHQPDNVETTAKSLLITEDPSSTQQFDVGDPSPSATTARVWLYDFATGTKRVVAKVDQSSDESPQDKDSAPAGKWGTWEASGIIDVSQYFGAGAFLIDVQAHTLWVAKRPGRDYVGPSGTPDGVPDFTYKREGGQLLLLRIPGA